MTRRSALGALAAASVFAGAAVAHADPIQFGVVGSAIDLSANVSEAILPGGTVFQDSHPLFGTEPDPNQSAELLHLSDKGVNGSGRSTDISGAFASSLAESNGNGGVGVSQLLFGDPGGAAGQDVVRQLVGQSLWPRPSSTTALLRWASPCTCTSRRSRWGSSAWRRCATPRAPPKDSTAVDLNASSSGGTASQFARDRLGAFVPEPGTMLLLGGLAGLVVFRLSDRR
ncbi:MAG TPA: PEP-CTERM sorting domain-containing protein [Myxococcota bacterium]|nr:PEP-CTERM sorting domain-containing protein [Myxococcota bacterium]